MAEVFNPPANIPVPELNFSDIDEYNKACDKFEADLKEFCIDRAKKSGADTKYIGDVIKLPYADSYAIYMVASLKPVQLIHIPIWDAWDCFLAKRLTKKDIVDMIESQKKLKELFGR